MIEFERSYDFLPLLLVASTALAILIYSAVRTSLIDFSLPLFFKLLAALLICIALEKPLLLQYTASDKLALLLDVSDSMEGTTADKLLAHFKESVPRNIDVQVFPFASEVSDIAIDLQELSSFTATQTAWSSLNIGNTNLEKALHEITSSHSGPVFLLSDGRETLGDVISHLSQQSIPTKLHPLMLMSNLQLNPGFELSRLDVPLLAPAAKSVQIRMVVQNTSEQTQDG